MDWGNLMQELGLTLVPILGSIVAYVLITIARYIATSSNNQIVKAALTNLEQIIFSTVTALSQTMVDDLKRNKANGKLTVEEAGLIKDKAISSIKNQVGSKDMEILAKYFSSIDELIDNMIEEKVAENKLRRGQI